MATREDLAASLVEAMLDRSAFDVNTPYLHIAVCLFVGSYFIQQYRLLTVICRLARELHRQTHVRPSCTLLIANNVLPGLQGFVTKR